MKKFIVSQDELDTLQSKLWDFCKDKGYYMRVMPCSKTIEVMNTKEVIAEIRILEVEEPYEIINLLKEA